MLSRGPTERNSVEGPRLKDHNDKAVFCRGHQVAASQADFKFINESI